MTAKPPETERPIVLDRNGNPIPRLEWPENVLAVMRQAQQGR